MSCLGSKHELLQVADHVIAHYYQRVPFVRNHPQAIDLDMLVMELMGGSIKMFPLSKDGSMLGMTAHERLIIRMELKDGTIIRDTLRPLDMLVMELMGGSIKMFPLSKDGSMLGMTAHERLIIRMELKDGTIIRDTLRPKDIVIDSSLAGFHNTGVRNFTLAHEIGHQLLHIYYPLLALSDQLEEDCADIIAEGLLLPECLVRASMAFFQFPDTLSHISRSQLDMNYPSFKKMARQLGVQRQLLANRMKYLHILTSDVPYRHTLSLMEAG